MKSTTGWRAALVLGTGSLTLMSLCSAAYAADPSDPDQSRSPDPPAPAAPVHRDGPGHTIEVSAGAATTDAPIGGLAYWLRTRRVAVGLLTQASWGHKVHVQGFETSNALRWRARVPVSVDLTHGSRARLALFVAPGLRTLTGRDRRSVATSIDSGFTATVFPTDTVSISAGLMFPFAIDVAPQAEVARFPGLVLATGAYWRFGPRLSVGLTGTVSIPEGYGGDSEKYVLEGSLGFRVHFGNPRRTRHGLPILNAAI